MIVERELVGRSLRVSGELLENPGMMFQHFLLFSWDFFFKKDMIFMGILTISRQFQGKMQSTFAVCFEISKQTTKQLCSLL